MSRCASDHTSYSSQVWSPEEGFLRAILASAGLVISKMHIEVGEQEGQSAGDSAIYLERGAGARGFTH